MAKKRSKKAKKINRRKRPIVSSPTKNTRLFSSFKNYHASKIVESEAPRPIRRLNDSLKSNKINRRDVQRVAKRINTPSLVSAFNQSHKSFATFTKEVCRKRQRRTEILHALNKTGSGSSRARKNFTPISSVRCK